MEKQTDYENIGWICEGNDTLTKFEDSSYEGGAEIERIYRWIFEELAAYVPELERYASCRGQNMERLGEIWMVFVMEEIGGGWQQNVENRKEKPKEAGGVYNIKVVGHLFFR